MCLLPLSAAALDVPAEYQRFIHETSDNKKGRLQWLCETFNICDKRRANRSVAMVIGVSQYDFLRPLQSTSKDASELAKYLLESGEFDQVVLLSESDATKERISWFMEDYFPALLKGENNSRFLFYFSGHGEYYKPTGRGYLRLVDNKKNQNFRSIGMDTVATWAERNTSNAIHSLFLIDACVSGIAGLETMGDDEKSVIPARDPRELIEEQAGYLITAGEGLQQAWADQKWKGSLFNYALMEGLQRGKADQQDSDGIITSLELFDYIDRVVRAEVPKGKKQTPQRWRFRPGSGDFFFKSPKTRISKPDPKTEFDAENMGSRSKPVDGLLRECQAHFNADRLTTGFGGNAADCYQEVLMLDRGNSAALDGLAAIEDRYRGWAERMLKQRKLERAKKYIEKIALFNPEGETVFELREELARLTSDKNPVAGGGPSVARKPYEPEMVAIQAGSFLMGSPKSEKNRDDDEGPQRRVKIGSFSLGKTEVTVRQFREFINRSGYSVTSNGGGGCYHVDGTSWKKDSQKNWQNPGFDQGDNHPVTCVNWNDARAYAEWLSGHTSRNYRLPTEAEWEYAARAGTDSVFSFGNCIHTDQANYDGNYDYNNCGAKTGVYRQQTVAVDDLKANTWGLRHMHGNVWEWVQDCYHSSYKGAPDDGTAWETGCGGTNPRVLRGGSWYNIPYGLRSAARLRSYPGWRYSDHGFRIARTD